MAAVHLTHGKGLFRVRVLPPDAAPAVPLAPETHVGHLSAKIAAGIIATHLGLQVIDETQKGGS